MTTIVGEQALRLTRPAKMCPIKWDWNKFILFCQDHEQGRRRDQGDKCPRIKRRHVFDGAHSDSVAI